MKRMIAKPREVKKDAQANEKPPIPLLFSKTGMLIYAQRRGRISENIDPRTATKEEIARHLQEAGAKKVPEALYYRLAGTNILEEYRHTPLRVHPSEYQRYMKFLKSLPNDLKSRVQSEVGGVEAVKSIDTLQAFAQTGEIKSERARILNTLRVSLNLARAEAIEEVATKRAVKRKKKGRGR